MMRQVVAEVVENVLLAERTWRVRIRCPEIAPIIRPGQFLMLRLPGTTDPLLGRPFALYDTVLDEHGQAVELDVVYLVVGKMTGLLAHLRQGESLEVWGPLGNGFPLLQEKRVNFVAGGIGQTPFLAYARELLGTRGYAGMPAQKRVEQVSLYYGVRTQALAAGVSDFEEAGCTVHLASDDGSIGYRGYVTQLLREQSPAGTLIGCGPEPMLHALNKVAESWSRPLYVSLETPMACGFGACFSCVTKVKAATESGWDYKRVCVEGPVFAADQLSWDSHP